jgi:beta-glucosidase
MKYVIEPGEFEILVGTSSREGDLQKVILTVTD